MRDASREIGVIEVLFDLADVDDADDVRAEMIMRETLAEVEALPVGCVLYLPEPYKREDAIALLERSIERRVDAGAMRAGARTVLGEIARRNA